GALCLAWPDGHLEEFEARVDGMLTWPPRGTAGFGYDPMFLPDGHTRTFGEMSAEEKHGLPPRGLGLSHRARAFLLLAQACLPTYSAMLFFESTSRSSLLVAHDLFRKPVSTFSGSCASGAGHSRGRRVPWDTRATASGAARSVGCLHRTAQYPLRSGSESRTVRWCRDG